MDSVSSNLDRAAAPLVSVLIVTTLGFGWAFAANAASFLAFAGCLMLAKGRPSQRLELDAIGVASRRHGLTPNHTRSGQMTIKPPSLIISYAKR